MRRYILIAFLSSLPILTQSTNVVLTNDDGWATAQIRAEYDALKAAGFKVVLSAPAVDKSGTGASTTTPTVLATSCEFNTCPVGSPAEGFNASDPFLNYVNGFPVDAVRYGIQTLAPKLLGAKPDLVISGSNVGSKCSNLGRISGSGTVGAAGEAALEGIPSIAFSGSTASQVSYTDLTTNPTSTSSIAAHIYTTLTLKFVNTLLANPAGSPLIPAGVSVNVNYAPTTNCPSASSFSFIFTRLLPSTTATDVVTCGRNQLPDETSTIRSGCFATVSVFNASTKLDVSATFQGAVLNKVQSILSCL
ncbi:survival protein sure-like phosphatase/nucleotidase [Infundibulicybe gibba]|nr:survival protein sure-like phosphatase/nucleotidase [Infundibulicybe gibba]